MKITRKSVVAAITVILALALLPHAVGKLVCECGFGAPLVCTYGTYIDFYFEGFVWITIILSILSIVVIAFLSSKNIVWILLILFASCTAKEEQSIKELPTGKKVADFEVCLGCTGIYVVEIEGHSYIVARWIEAVSIVHAEHCKNHKR